MNTQEEMKLEQLIDAHGLSAVLDALARIAYEKAEHIQSSYGDAPMLVKAWKHASQACDRASSTVVTLSLGK